MGTKLSAQKNNSIPRSLSKIYTIINQRVIRVNIVFYIFVLSNSFSISCAQSRESFSLSLFRQRENQEQRMSIFKYPIIEVAVGGTTELNHLLLLLNNFLLRSIPLRQSNWINVYVFIEAFIFVPILIDSCCTGW